MSELSEGLRSRINLYFYKSARSTPKLLTNVVFGSFTGPENSWSESEGHRPWNIISPPLMERQANYG